MKAILKNGKEITINNMYENYYERVNVEENKRVVSFNTEGETIDSLKTALTPENLASVKFTNDTGTETREGLQLIMISKSTNNEGSTISVRLAV